MKKLIWCFLVLLLTGCGAEKQIIDEAFGDAKTYLFFKDFNPNNYYVELWDRNNNKNDDTKIIIARYDNKYYYEINGSSNMKVIQKDGYMYTIDPQMQSYNQVKKEVEDYAYGILPSDIEELKVKGYETGEAKVYGKKYIYEKYTSDIDETIYYFDDETLVYIKYFGPTKNVFFKFDLMKSAFDDLFEIPNDYLLITY